MSDPIRVVDSHLQLWVLVSSLYLHFKKTSESFIDKMAEIIAPLSMDEQALLLKATTLRVYRK